MKTNCFELFVTNRLLYTYFRGIRFPVFFVLRFSCFRTFPCFFFCKSKVISSSVLRSFFCKFVLMCPHSCFNQFHTNSKIYTIENKTFPKKDRFYIKRNSHSNHILNNRTCVVVHSDNLLLIHVFNPR